ASDCQPQTHFFGGLRTGTGLASKCCTLKERCGMSDDSTHRFQIYLNDHLALIRGEIELIERCQLSNREPPLHDMLTECLKDVREQRQTILEVLASVEGHEDLVKAGMAWFAEKVGRLKL